MIKEKENVSIMKLPADKKIKTDTWLDFGEWGELIIYNIILGLY